MRNLLVLSFLLAAFNLNSLWAQTRKIENFTLPDAVSGKNISLSSLQGKKAIVILFTSNFCPYSKLYEERFASLVKSYKGNDVTFLMINPNDPRESSEDSMEAMKEKANSWGLDIPYLADKNQLVSQMFGASKTPEVFVLTSKPTGFSLAYSGALDDNPQVAKDVNQNYLKQAIDAVLQGKVINTPNKRPVGCMIKVKN